MKWIGVAARLLLGGVWITAGVLKLGDPAESVRAVRAYDLLPETVVGVVGHALPVFEVALGVILVAGLATRVAGLLSALLLVAFVIGISSAWARGLSIECGCFGGGGGPAVGAADKYPWEIARDIGLLAASAWLMWRPRTPYSLDAVVLPQVTVPEVPQHADGGGGAKGARTRAAQQAAAIRRAAQAKELGRRNRMVVAGVVASLVAVTSVGYAVQTGRDETGVVSAVPSGVEDDYVLSVGKADAPVVVDIYEDPMCPFCGEFEQESHAQVSDWLEKGEVRVRYHLIAFLDRASTNRYSTRAMNAVGVVLDAAGVDVAKRFHDLLFEQQPPEGTAGLSDQELIDLAVEAGADRAAVTSGIESVRYATWVKNATDRASRDGVNSTPTVLVDGNALPQSDVPSMVASLEQAVRDRLAQ